MTTTVMNEKQQPFHCVHCGKDISTTPATSYNSLDLWGFECKACDIKYMWRRNGAIEVYGSYQKIDTARVTHMTGPVPAIPARP